MKICSAIIHAINFENKEITPCCNVHARKIPILPYAGELFDKNAYFKYIMRTLQNLQIDEELCRGCDRLENLTNLSVQEGLEYVQKILSSHPLTQISINHFRNFCNCKCVYCNLWNQKQTDLYSILPTLQHLQDLHLLSQDCQISWGGGEPSILKEFEATSIWIMKNHYFQKIHTNAIKQSESIAQILKNGMCNVESALMQEPHKRTKK